MHRFCSGGVVRWLLGLSFLIFLPTSLFANAGTPLMWLSALHLMCGNFAIAALESALFVRSEKVRGGGARFVLFLGANYLTMFAGMVFLWQGTHLTSWWLDLSIGNAIYRALLLTLVLITYPMTALLEAPFCYAMLKKGGRSVGLALRYSFFANAISYALLLVLYLLSSSNTMLTEIDMVPSPEMAIPPIANVYYITNESIQKTTTSGGEAETVAIGDFDRIYLEYNEKLKAYDLVATQEGYTTPTLIVAGAAVIAGSMDGRIVQANAPIPIFGTDLRTKEEKEGSRVYLGRDFYMDQAMIYTTSTLVRVETPLSGHYISYATILPKEQIVFAMRSPQASRIMLFDPEKMIMAPLAMGYRPVVAYRRTDVD